MKITNILKDLYFAIDENDPDQVVDKILATGILCDPLKILKIAPGLYRWLGDDEEPEIPPDQYGMPATTRLITAYGYQTRGY